MGMGKYMDGVESRPGGQESERAAGDADSLANHIDIYVFRLDA